MIRRLLLSAVSLAFAFCAAPATASVTGAGYCNVQGYTAI